MIYLDYAASSPPFPEVLQKMTAVAAQAYGNPGAIHAAGGQARGILHNSRLALARTLRVRPEEVFFTSGGTESNNWAVRIGCGVSGKKHIVCFAAEHSSVLEPVRQMEKKGYAVTYLAPDRNGLLSAEALEGAFRPDTALLCVQAVNNETGVMQDEDALSRMARRHRAIFFCDAVQSFGHDIRNLHKADLISLSAHKLGGPRGVGCLVIRQPLLPSAMILGGGQEFGFRSGTENVPGIAGFALAAELCGRNAEAEAARLTGLRQMLEQGLKQTVPGLQIAGEAAPRGSILCCRFPGISAEETVVRLDAAGICASPGAACAARSGRPSHVLLSMGYTPEEASEFVRFSPGRDTTETDIEKTLEILKEIHEKRSCPYGK